MRHEMQPPLIRTECHVLYALGSQVIDNVAYLRTISIVVYLFSNAIDPANDIVNTMAASSLHILSFSLRNPYFDPGGPFPTLYSLLTVRSPAICALDLSRYAGRTILITGGASGCGFEFARALSAVGCHLILTARNQERGGCQTADSESGPKFRSSDHRQRVRAGHDILQIRQILPSRLAKLVTRLDIAILDAGVY